jgi:hypothetical protein
VGDDHDRVVALQLVHEVFDARRRDRVERRGRLVHQDHVRLDRERARDAQTLLLPARERERILLQPVLDLVPEGGLVERSLDTAIEVALQAKHPGAEGDVLVNRLRERVRLLEDHPDPPPHLHRIDVRRVEIAVVVEDRPGDGGAGNQVVHAVEAPDERALATPRRADERSDEVLAHLHRHAREREVAAVVHGERVDVEHDPAAATVPRDLGGEVADERAIEGGFALFCAHRRRHRGQCPGSREGQGVGSGEDLVTNWRTA